MKKLLLGLTSIITPVTVAFAQTSSKSYASNNAGADLFAGILIFYCICFILILAITGTTGYLIYKDAKRSNIDNPGLWGVLTLFLGLIGVILYLSVGKNDK